SPEHPARGGWAAATVGWGGCWAGRAVAHFRENMKIYGIPSPRSTPAGPREADDLGHLRGEFEPRGVHLHRVGGARQRGHRAGGIDLVAPQQAAGLGAHLVVARLVGALLAQPAAGAL